MKEAWERKPQLDAVIGSETFKFSYTKSLVDDWIIQLKLLSIIVGSEPQSAYSVFVDGFKGNHTHNTTVRRFCKIFRKCYPFQLYPRSNWLTFIFR